MKTKTIILNGENSSRGIASIYEEEGLLNCRIRVYGIEALSASAKIGVYHNGNTFTANLIQRNGSYTSSLVGDFDINQDFYIAIIETNENNKVLLKGGTYSGYFSNEEIFEKDEKEEQLIDETLFNKEEKDCNTIQNEDCNKCETCIYKKTFFEKKNAEEETPQPVQQIDEQIEKEKIIAQVEDVFKNYPQDETLNNLLPNSKFVKIDENANGYSIGALYVEEKMKYLCYAKKCKYNETAPEELGKHYRWLPLDSEDPLTDGYNIVFQDIEDLKILDTI